MTSRIFHAAAIVSTGLLLMAARTPPSSSRDRWKNLGDVCNNANFTDSIVVDGVLIQTLANPEEGEGCIRATDDGKTFFRRKISQGSTFTFGQRAGDDGSIAAIKNGTDLTGRGKPDVLISAWSGGAHCCRTDYIFELLPFRLLGVLDARDADESHFAKLDNSGRYYYVSADYVFAYWHGSFAGSPVEPVILEYRDDKHGGGYHLALDKMRRPAPTQQEWDKALAAVKNDVALQRANMANDMRTDLWSEVLHLLYTGHSDLAWKFLQEAGPEAETDPDPDLRDFCTTLKASDYWRDLEPAITTMPKSCKRAQPPELRR
jgi:hypothetical protein